MCEYFCFVFSLTVNSNWGVISQNNQGVQNHMHVTTLAAQAKRCIHGTFTLVGSCTSFAQPYMETSTFFFFQTQHNLLRMTLLICNLQLTECLGGWMGGGGWKHWSRKPFSSAPPTPRARARWQQWLVGHSTSP